MSVSRSSHDQVCAAFGASGAPNFQSARARDCCLAFLDRNYLDCHRDPPLESEACRMGVTTGDPRVIFGSGLLALKKSRRVYRMIEEDRNSLSFREEIRNVWVLNRVSADRRSASVLHDLA